MHIRVLGAGLAGCEAALYLAGRGYAVELWEQKPHKFSPAHKNADFAELVCSNSLKADRLDSASGLLKAEMKLLGSALLPVAEGCRVAAGGALAVDREAFARAMTEAVNAHPGISVRHARIESLDDAELVRCGGAGSIIAAGPLASDGLSAALGAIIGQEYCYFYDAIAPIVWTHSLDRSVVFRASRYGAENGEAQGEGDYLNCPMSREEYETFFAALCEGRVMETRDFEREVHFEGCMPLEALALRGPRTLTFGPLKPVGFVDPRTGRRPWAVLQLRAENANAETCNLVGCQTKLLQSEQERIFRLVPGMENAEFARYGSMHRNTYVNAPEALSPELELKNRPGVYLAGQISGVEGYVESAASGLWLGLFLAARASGRALPAPPPETALGALLGHLRRPEKHFQPSNVHFGLMPELDERARKKERKALYAARAEAAFARWLTESGLRNG